MRGGGKKRALVSCVDVNVLNACVDVNVGNVCVEKGEEGGGVVRVST